jgi:hypothetical protein
MIHPHDDRKKRKKIKQDGDEPSASSPDIPDYSLTGRFSVFLKRYCLPLIIFLFSLFFIISISNPALFINDEWITANQVHQLDIGHQVTFNEGKYGVWENGTPSEYFESRQNVLMYSLALPLTALPFVKLFGLLGDNFRLLIIFIWSIIPVLIALLVEVSYPRFSRFRGVNLTFFALLLGLFLFLANILMYKQFPFSAPDAPFEVAAIVLANHVLFALTVVVVFETCRHLFKDLWMALFSTFSCIACSSYLFWAGTAKDHMLTVAVFAFVIYFFILYLSFWRWRDATLSFICTGLLVWTRPELGAFIAIFITLFFCILLLYRISRHMITVSNLVKSLTSIFGVMIGAIPFFFNNLVVNNNLLIPAYDLQRTLAQSGDAYQGLSPIQQAGIQQIETGPGNGLNPFATLPKIIDMIRFQLFSGWNPESMGSYAGVLFFPKNGNIGFFILCPLILIALVCAIIWHKRVFEGSDNKNIKSLFLIIAFFAVFCTYLPIVAGMNTSAGVTPDMRYLSPAYLPAGLVSMLVIRRTPLLDKPTKSMKNAIISSMILVPLLIILMFIAPFSHTFSAGYPGFFEMIILCEIALFCGVLILYRSFYNKSATFLEGISYLLVLIIVTVLAFQIMLTFLIAVAIKFSGYPLWIPLIREGHRLFIRVG